jgi:hypothetical protein
MMRMDLATAQWALAPPMRPLSLRNRAPRKDSVLPAPFAAWEQWFLRKALPWPLPGLRERRPDW